MGMRSWIRRALPVAVVVMVYVGTTRFESSSGSDLSYRGCW
jgi:hypothetical protein